MVLFFRVTPFTTVFLPLYPQKSGVGGVVIMTKTVYGCPLSWGHLVSSCSRLQNRQNNLF